MADPPPDRRRHRRDAVIERAADLARRMEGMQTADRSFTVGQQVRHAEYGTGLITRISGTGPRAVATVIFDGAAGTRTFILGHGSLTAAE